MSIERDINQADFARALKHSQRDRILRGELKPGDVADLRRFVRLTQAYFAAALGVSVHTLSAWEKVRRYPKGPALTLLRLAARRPGLIRENLSSAASRPARKNF